MKSNFKKIISLFFSSMIVFSASVGSLKQSETNAETKQEKVIALTFDDGPNTTTTNEVLDILEEYDALGTFFLIGTNIDDESAQSVKRAYDMGCEIGNHSKTHSNMPDMTSDEMVDEIDYVNEKIYEITGEYPKYFRPPFIATSDEMYEVIDLTFICGVGCNDFMADVTAEQRADAVISSAKDGQIVLLHDAAGNDQTVEALKTIIPTLQEDGYKFVTLSQLFEAQGETPKRNLIYSEVTKYPCSDYVLHKNVFSGEASGDSSWSGWGETAVFDGSELEALGDKYAIEVDYTSVDSPALALQAWSNGNSFWYSVKPAYYNGERACFLANDIQNALDENGMTLSALDRITVIPYGSEMTLTRADILVKNETEIISFLPELGEFILQQGDSREEFDVNGDGIIDCFDVVAERKRILDE